MKKILFSLLALIILFTNCNPKDPSETLLIYTALELEQIKSYKEVFEKKYPQIKLNVVRKSTGIISSQLLAEKDNPQADLVWGLAATSLLECDEQGILEPYSPRGLERIQSGFKDSKKIPHWVGIDAWMTGIIVNTIELKNKQLAAPKSFADLIKPIYKGLITMPNPKSSGTGYLTVSAILQLMGEEKGWDYLKQLDKNIAFYTHSGSKPAKLAGKGEFPIGISFAYRGMIQKKKGEPVETIFPLEGSGWDMEANALIKKKNIKDEAKVFLDWAISNSAMKAYSKSFPILAIENTFTIPEGFPANPHKQLIKNDFEWAAKNKKNIQKKWSELFETKTEKK